MGKKENEKRKRIVCFSLRAGILITRKKIMCAGICRNENTTAFRENLFFGSLAAEPVQPGIKGMHPDADQRLNGPFPTQDISASRKKTCTRSAKEGAGWTLDHLNLPRRPQLFWSRFAAPGLVQFPSQSSQSLCSSRTTGSQPGIDAAGVAFSTLLNVASFVFISSDGHPMTGNRGGDTVTARNTSAQPKHVQQDLEWIRV